MIFWKEFLLLIRLPGGIEAEPPRHEQAQSTRYSGYLCSLHAVLLRKMEKTGNS